MRRLWGWLALGCRELAPGSRAHGLTQSSYTVALSHRQTDRFGAAWHRLTVRRENSVTKARVQTLCPHTANDWLHLITAISPCVRKKSASAKLFLDLHTMSAPSGEERTLDRCSRTLRSNALRYATLRRFSGAQPGPYMSTAARRAYLVVPKIEGPKR
jgi:hypothetical protein